MRRSFVVRVVLVASIAGLAGCGGGSSPTASENFAPPSSQGAPSTTVGGSGAATTTVSGNGSTFGDGNWQVGSKVAPGSYRTTGGSDCHWRRQKDTSGSSDADLGDEYSNQGPQIVTILPTDAEFDSDGCGRWSTLASDLPRVASFGDGTWAVSEQIAPGTYRATDTADCSWSRESDFTHGEHSELGKGSSNQGPDVVTVLSSDVEFNSDGCGTWSHLPASLPRLTSFGDGTWVVGSQVAPGRYTAPGGDSCFWARLHDFTGTGDSNIDTHYEAGSTTVTIAATDKGFESSGCGTWTSG